MASTWTRLTQQALAIRQKAEDEGRDITEGESREMHALLDAAQERKHDYQMKSLGQRLGGGSGEVVMDVNAVQGDDAGSRFTASEGYRKVKDAGSRGQSWSTGPIDVGMMTKGTLLEGSGSPGSGSGGGLLATPQVVPGVVNQLFQPLTVESLLLSGQATTSVVRYATEGTATSGAAGVAEGGTKPESTLAFSTRDEPVKKIATSLTISDELLEDAVAVQQFINGELSKFVNIETERQLLRGTSGGNEVQGLLTSRGVPVYSQAGTTVGGVAEILFKAMNGMRGSAFVEPSWVVVHPTEYQLMRLSKDTANQYYGGGPFQGPYGSGQDLAASGQVSGATDTVWGKPVYVTAAIGAGTALVGSRSAAQVWSRGGVSVEATNSHASYFVQNLSMMRAERRLALTLYRPQAMVEVRVT